MELKAGDLIMTGTPAGVGPIVEDNCVTGGIAGLGEILISVGPRRANTDMGAAP